MNSHTSKIIDSYYNEVAYSEAVKGLNFWKNQEKEFLEEHAHQYHRDYCEMDRLAEQYALLTAKQSCEATLTWRNEITDARRAKAYRRIDRLKDERESVDWWWEQAIDRVEWFEERIALIRDEIRVFEILIATI